jgi:SAM-dependent methyltransferase
MDRESLAHLTQLYRRSLEAHGPTARGQRWKSEASQRERFRLLALILSSEGGRRRLGSARFSLADVGCGAGDLLGYLREAGWRGRGYHGFDIVPEMVDAARRKQRGRGGRFEVRDVLRQGFPARYDYVVASGIFNLRVVDSERYLRRMVAAMYAACRVGVAFNVLQPRPRDPEDDGAYEAYFARSYFGATPAELLVLGASVGAWVELAFSDELPGDTTVLLWRPA